MTVSRSNYVVRWAYLFSSYIPGKSSICNLFWRTFLWTPGILALLGLLVAPYIVNWQVTSIATGIIVGIVGLGALTAYLHDRVSKASELSPWKLFWTRVGAAKRHVCPLVTIR